jgi:hypothetical protein
MGLTRPTFLGVSLPSEGASSSEDVLEALRFAARVFLYVICFLLLADEAGGRKPAWGGIGRTRNQYSNRVVQEFLQELPKLEL